MNLVKNYTLYSVTCTNANTEYSQAVTAQKAYIRIHSSDLTSQLRLSLTALGSGTGEIIFPGGEWFTPWPLSHGVKTIYIQSNNAGTVVQIIEFQIE